MDRDNSTSSEAMNSPLGLPLDASLRGSFFEEPGIGDVADPPDVPSLASEGPPHRIPDSTTENVGLPRPSALPNQHQLTLEARIEELETKLSVLSRMLRQHQQSLDPKGGSGAGSLLRSLSPSRPTSPRNVDENGSPSSPAVDFLDDENGSGAVTPVGDRTSIPHLESPALHASGKRIIDDEPRDRTRHLDMPTNISALSNIHSSLPKLRQRSSQSATNADAGMPRVDSEETLHRDNTKSSAEKSSPPPPRGIQPHNRTLSFRLLYGGDEEAYIQGKHSSNTPVTTSMTAAEGRWLRPLILNFQKANTKHRKVFSQPNIMEQAGPDESIRHKWLNYLNSFQDSAPDVDEQMEEFVKVPAQLESIMMYGFWICVDSYLYMITILPIRFVWSCLLLLLRLCTWKKRPSSPFQFHRRHTYQMIQVAILVFLYRYVLAGISIGKLYHWIRGQAMIKLYVLIAMVEVFDRLMCGLGQDCLESMYWNTVNRPRSSRMLISILLVLIYATCHTLILFVHVETLNVAMNSADQALLTLLISGNFAEIKSTVFKKYNKPALFKITASDICERFKLGLFLNLVLLMNVCQGMEYKQLIEYLRICGYVWCAELVADAIKHSFITKFNFLPARVYPEYALLLAGDVTGIGHEALNLDHSHAVVKRLAFSQIPLVVVMFRLLKEAAKYGAMNGYGDDWPNWAIYTLMVGGWLGLVAIKIALGDFLHRLSMHKLRSAPEVSYSPPVKKKKK